MNRSMNGNNLTAPAPQHTANTSARQRRNSISSMDDYSASEYKPPVPVRRSIRKNQEVVLSERDQWKNWVRSLQEEMEYNKQQAERYKSLYEKQKTVCDARTEEFLKLEAKYLHLEKQRASQENFILNLNLEHQKVSEELEDRTTKLAETVSELNSVIMKSEELAKKLHEFERQLQMSESARNMELENLRSLQSSFQASERHFASVLEQVQSLIQENELVYETNCKLTQEKLKVERDLSLKNKMSSSLTAELAEAQEKMKQINNTLKSFEQEKACLYKKVQEQRSMMSDLEAELKQKDRQLDAADQAKTDLEGQLKLANLCLSRALSVKDKANIFPHRSELKPSEASASNSGMQSSIRALREEVSAKDKIITRLIEENNKLEEQLQNVKMELLKQQEMNCANQAWFRNVQGAPKDLQQELVRRERIIDSMKLTIEKAISERNRLGLKCLRRKEQAALLKEKNKVLEDIMLIGNRLYEEGLKKIRNMKMAQENAYTSTLNLVGIVSGNSRPPTPSCRKMAVCGNSETASPTNGDGQASSNIVENLEGDMVMKI